MTGALDSDLERILRDEIETQASINAALRVELDVQKGRADHWRQLCDWAYSRSSEGLNSIGSRDKRDQALSDINKRLGGAVR